MTISTTAASQIFIGDGATTVFNFSFVADQASDIVVKYTDLEGFIHTLSPGQYSITINPVPVGQLWGIGGSVTYPLSGPPIPSGAQIAVIRQVPYTQNVSVANQGNFYPQAVEQALDILELQIQQLSGSTGQVFLNSPVVMDFRYFGAGSLVPVGIQGDRICPFPMKIISWTIQADQVGSISLDIWSRPFQQDTPPTIFDSICAGNFPALVGQQQVQSTNTTGWIVEFAGNDAFRFNVNSVTNIQNFTLSLVLVRSDIPSTTIGGGSSGGGGGGGGGSGTGLPTGPAGGDLQGTYPNPLLVSGSVDTDEIVDTSVTTSKLASGAVTGAKTATNTITNSNLAQMPANTYKGNPTGATGNAQDVPASTLASAIGALTTTTTGLPQQGILFSLTGGAFNLINKFPAGAAGPTGSRTSTGLVNITLGSTTLKSGYYTSTVNFTGGGSGEGGQASALGAPMSASGTYAFNIQHCSSKTYFDADLVYILFY